MAKKRSVKKVVKAEVVSKKSPVGVQIISVLYFIMSVLLVVLGVLLIIGANKIVSYLVSTTPELASIITGGLLIGMGIFLIAVGILAFFVARGLWKLKPWARIVGIIVAIIGVISAIYAIISNFNVGDIIRLVIHAVIGIYLIFNKQVINAFK